MVRFVKVDIDESPDVAGAYKVFSIPTIAMFEDGELVATSIGAQPSAAIERELGLAA